MTVLLLNNQFAWYSNQRRKGVLQGSLLSPLLSNIMLQGLDKQLKEQGLKYVAMLMILVIVFIIPAAVFIVSSLRRNHFISKPISVYSFHYEAFFETAYDV